MHILNPFWNHWFSLQYDWLSTVRFIHKSHLVYILLFCISSSANENGTVKNHCLANLAIKFSLWFQNGSNKVAIELPVMKFCLEIIFVIELVLRARSILKSRVWFQTKLHSTQFNYHYILYGERELSGRTK